VDELMARELYNALLEQERGNGDGAAQRFMALASRSYNTVTSEAHDLWRLVVFGSLIDPCALLLDGSVPERTEHDQAPIDTLDLQQQLLALIELHELLTGAVASLSAEDKSAVQGMERQALLRAALYFTLAFLKAPDDVDNIFLLQLHPDGAVLYDSFHGDVVPYIARNVYGWPEWADIEQQADARGFGDVGGRMMRSIDDQWLMRANALLRGRQVKRSAYTADEYNAIVDARQRAWLHHQAARHTAARVGAISARAAAVPVHRPQGRTGDGVHRAWHHMARCQPIGRARHTQHQASWHPRGT
jgi:hypothetical protein